MNKILIFIFTSVVFISCEECVTCEYEYVDVNTNETVTVSDEKCSSDNDFLDNFRNSHKQTAEDNGTVATCN